MFKSDASDVKIIQALELQTSTTGIKRGITIDTKDMEIGFMVWRGADNPADTVIIGSVEHTDDPTFTVFEEIPESHIFRRPNPMLVHQLGGIAPAFGAQSLKRYIRVKINITFNGPAEHIIFLVMMWKENS